MKGMLRRGTLGVLLAVSTACGVYIRPHPGVIYVAIAPPPPHAEMVVTPPARGYAWMPGHWVWQVRSYAWVPGAWVEMPAGYSGYAPGYWSHDYHGWFWIEGRWR
jgi:hypothetical protein